METLLKDFRLAVRMLRKNPGFTAIAVITLALGIAVNATMFSLVSGFLLRRPPGRQPERVAVVSSVDPNGNFLPDANPVSAPNYLAWRDANHVFTDLAAAEYRTVTLAVQNQPEATRAAAVSPNYFSVLGVSAEFGRTFTEGEDQPGHNHVLILGHELWERRFGSDPAIVGRTVRLNREDWDVVGVMPANFKLLGFIPQLWIPLELKAADQTGAARKNRSLYLFGRLRPGVTVEQARAEMATLARRAGNEFPETEKGWGTAVRTLPDFLIYTFGIRSGLAVVMTVVGFVLLIACANVAGLLLARAAGRRKELAIRISLGAGRMRIVRQLLTEGSVIALLGGGIGLLLSYWGIHFVRINLNFVDVIRDVPIELDWNVLWFVLVISVLSAALCGMGPALNAARTDVNTSLKDESRASSTGKSQGRLRMVMVTGEIALALFLLVGTGLLIQGIAAIHSQNLGFQPQHLLTAGVTLDEAQYQGSTKQSAFVQEMIRHARQIPGVEGVAVASDLPVTGAGSVTLRIKGQAELPANERRSALDFVVTPEFFRVAGIPLLRGRTFSELDNSMAPRVVVVNQEFVRRNLHDQDPLGKQIALDVPGASTEWSEVVGVVGNVKSYSEETRDDPEVYETFQQRPVASMSLMLLATGDPNSLTADLRAAVKQVDPELPLARLMSMPALIEIQKAGNPFFTRILGTFAALALILAAIGIYGLMAYSVRQRTHEIGIRMALGARSPDVLRMILWQGAKMAAIGGIVGLVLALPLPKVFDAIFYGLHVREPGLYFIVPLAMLVVALVASYVPALRAARVDPMNALREN
ncbi:MAG TPA: ABC transporter permease [Candidatus Angelobacter sp.]